MKKRSKAATKTAKARPRKALKPKGRSALKALSHRGAAHAREIEIARITREKDEALEQQTATSEVLQVIGSSPGDLQRVFDAMLQNAIRICEASYGNIYRWDGQNLRLAAKRNIPVTYTEFRKRSPFQDSPIMRRVLATKTFLHLIDAMADPAYSERRDPGLVAAVEFGGLRTFLVVPLLNGDDLVGLFTLGRQHVLAFTSKQIALVTNFAAQAVIAIENARLLNELRQRTADLSQRTVDLTESIGAADGNRRGASGHQQLSRRSGASVCHNAGEGRSHLRRDFWKYLPLEQQRVAPHVIPQHAARVCRTP